MRVFSAYEKPSLDDLTHYGVKGMKWGVRNDDRPAGVNRFRAPPTSGGPKMDPKVHPDSQAAARKVAALMKDRYGFNITEVRSFGPGHPEYENGTLAYVSNTGRSKPEGVVEVTVNDIGPALKASEKAGWLAKGMGTHVGVLTHEAGHAVFHSREKYDKQGQIVGGEHLARRKANEAMIAEARRSGIKDHKLIGKISGYAATTGIREEIEAELFSQYHWSPNPPSFVKAWGETLHHEMGIDGTPFRELEGR